MLLGKSGRCWQFGLVRFYLKVQERSLKQFQLWLVTRSEPPCSSSRFSLILGRTILQKYDILSTGLQQFIWLRTKNKVKHIHTRVSRKIQQSGVHVGITENNANNHLTNVLVLFSGCQFHNSSRLSWKIRLSHFIAMDG